MTENELLATIAIVIILIAVAVATWICIFIVKSFFKSLSSSPDKARAKVEALLIAQKAKEDLLKRQQEELAALERQKQGTHRLESTIQHCNRTPFAVQEGPQAPQYTTAATAATKKIATEITAQKQKTETVPQSPVEELISEDFDLRKAVLYSEILNAKCNDK